MGSDDQFQTIEITHKSGLVATYTGPAQIPVLAGCDQRTLRADEIVRIRVTRASVMPIGHRWRILGDAPKGTNDNAGNATGGPSADPTGS